MKIYSIFLVVIVMVIATAVWYLGRSGAESIDTKLLGEDQAVEAEKKNGLLTTEKPKRPKMNMRAFLTQVIEKEVTPLDDLKKVESYLALLKKRAREKQQVTALEVGPGVEAITALEHILGPEETSRRIMAFTDEMNALSKEFGHLPEQPPPTLTTAEAINILEEIENESDPALKQQAIRKYIERAAATEDPEKEMALMEKLNETIRRNRPAPEPPDMDAIAKTIQNAEDNEAKQKAVREYINASGELAPEDEMRAMERLNELTKE